MDWLSHRVLGSITNYTVSWQTSLPPIREHATFQDTLLTRVTTCVRVDKLRRCCRMKTGNFRLEFWNAWCRDMPNILVLHTMWSHHEIGSTKTKEYYHAAHEDHSVCCSASRNGRVTVFVFLRKITVVTRFASQRLLCTLGWTFRIFGTVHHVGLSFSRLLGFPIVAQ